MKRTVSVAALLMFCATVTAAEAPAERKKNTEFKIEAGELVLPGSVVFDAGTATLKGESDSALWFIADFLESKPAITKLRIEGHVQGAKEAQELSEKRALAVVQWLVAHGTDGKRLLAVGFGDTKPVAGNATPEERAKNTRIEARPAEMRGRLIGGMPADGGGKAVSVPEK